MTTGDEDSSAENSGPTVFRDRSISYLELPATNVDQSARFYSEVFGWTVNGDGDHRGFTDGSGHVIGHWRADITPAGETGVRAYIYTDNIDDILHRIVEADGHVVRPRWDEGDVRAALFKDPAGNVLGVWDHPEAR